MNAQMPMVTAPDLPTPADTYDHSARSQTRVAMIAAGILMALVLFGAILVPVGGAVIATAEVAPESEIKRIAHPIGGVISEILVRDGDAVEEGDLLMRLDAEVSSVDAEFSKRSLAQLLAQRARLSAEVADEGTIRFPAELLNDDSDIARQAIATERRRFSLNRAEQANLRAQADERVNQLLQQIESYRAQIESFKAQQALIKPELEMVREMYGKGYVTIRRLNEMERSAIDLQGSIGALQANIAQANAAISQTREQRIQIGQTARTQASAELAAIESAINQQSVASASAGDQFERSEIRASYAGTVDKLAFSSVGEVVRAAETILQIIPRKDRLVFNGTVSPSDIDRVEKGQAVRIRLSAFNQATTPEIKGSVIFVSADPVTDERTGARFYRVRVAMDPNGPKVPEGIELVSGMPAELLIETGSRSLLSYMTKPLVDQFQRAFRN